MTSTKEVIDHHLKAFGERDLSGVLSDYAPNVIFFTSHGALHGPDAIRPLFQTMIAEFSKPGTAFNMKQHFVDGDYVYILWSAETADNIYELGPHCCTGRQYCGPVIHREDYPQGVKMSQLPQLLLGN